MTAKLTTQMEKALACLSFHGKVWSGSKRYGGFATGTIVGLMNRGIIREADRFGFHRAATSRDEDHARVMAIHIGTFRQSCASMGCTGCAPETPPEAARYYEVLGNLAAEQKAHEYADQARQCAAHGDWRRALAWLNEVPRN